jgi:hypothetical protein
MYDMYFKSKQNTGEKFTLTAPAWRNGEMVIVSASKTDDSSSNPAAVISGFMVHRHAV